VSVAVYLQGNTKHVCKEAEVRAHEERNHVDQREGSGSDASLREIRHAEAKAEDIYREVDQLDKGLCSALRT
jgi:hypothetical protein